MNHQRRDRLVYAFRRHLATHLKVAPFRHQADWWLASAGYTLTGALAAPEATLYQDIRLRDTSVVRMAVEKRPGGIAKVIADLGAYKCLAVDTDVPTVRGMKRLGDLTTEDRVFDEHGYNIGVESLVEPHIDPRGTYRITFNDGAEIVAGGSHDWWVLSIADRTQTRATTSECLSTHALYVEGAKNRYGQSRWAIPVAEAWEYGGSPLPIDPYVLGAWLGDGTGSTGIITTADQEIIDACVEAGYPCRRVPSSPYSWRVEGLTAQLRSLGVLERKHLPDACLYASTPDRMALVQGLMDTDGSASRLKGRCEFTNTNPALVYGLWRLLASLGIQSTVTECRARLYGRDCGPAYRVLFTTEQRVFCLSRKARRLPTTRGPRTTHRSIVSIERVPDVPVSCIRVASDTHRFLCGPTGIPTQNCGKSWGGALWLSGFAAVPNGRVDLIGLEYDICSPEFEYLAEMLLSDRGLGLPYRRYHNQPKAGRMLIELNTGCRFECRSWERKDILKGKERDCYYFAESYMLPGLSAYTSIAQNLRKRRGWAVFTTTADRPWVTIFHEHGHGKRAEWHCTCNVHARENPYTFSQHDYDRDHPDGGGMMTREQFAVSWEGKLGEYVGRVYNYQRGDRVFDPSTHPEFWKAQEATT